MPLPPRRYFFLPDVARRWGTTALDLATYAHEGLLELCVMTAATQVRFGWIDGEPEDCGHVPGGTRVLSGPQPLRPADLWPIIANRVGTIDHFKATEPNGYVALLEDAEPIRVTLHQLLVTREERDRFEHEYGLAPVDDPPLRANGAFSHADNYSDVTLLGRRHVLGPLQASIVRELHAASLRGDDWMSHQELLRACGAKSTRIVDVFKSQPHWRELITLDGRGNCRLALPDRSPSKARQRAFRRALQTRRPRDAYRAVDNHD